MGLGTLRVLLSGHSAIGPLQPPDTHRPSRRAVNQKPMGFVTISTVVWWEIYFILILD